MCFCKACGGLSLFHQHLSVTLCQGGTNTGVESLGELLLLLSDRQGLTVFLYGALQWEKSTHRDSKTHRTMSSRGEMKPRSLPGVCEPAHLCLPGWPTNATDVLKLDRSQSTALGL